MSDSFRAILDYMYDMDVVCVQTAAYWEWLLPIIQTAVSNISVACVEDWGTCFATASVRHTML